MAKIFNDAFTKYTNGFNVGNENIGLEAAKITSDTVGVTKSWPETIVADGNGLLIPNVNAVDTKIKEQIGTVYKVKGTHTVAKDDIVEGQITKLPEAVNGDVYNIALPADVPNAKIGDQIITNGDNIVFVESETEGEEGSWDKLAGAVDTTTFASKEWVNDGTVNGSLPMQAISGAYNSYDDMTAEGAKEDALVTNAGIQDYVDTMIENGINAYSAIYVNGSKTEAENYDVFKLQDGDGVKLEPVVDGVGNPTVKFNTNIQITGKNGSADDALTFTAVSAVSEGQSQFDITIPDATTEKAGVTKAAYYSDPADDGDGLIYLF